MGKLFLRIILVVLLGNLDSFAQDQFYVYRLNGNLTITEDNVRIKAVKGTRIGNSSTFSLGSSTNLILVNSKGKLFKVPNNKFYDYSSLNELSPLKSINFIHRKYLEYVWRKFRNKSKYKSNYGLVYRDFNSMKLIQPKIKETIYESSIIFKWVANTNNESTYVLLKDNTSGKLSSFNVNTDSLNLEIDGLDIKFGGEYSWTVSNTSNFDIDELVFFDFKIATKKEQEEFKNHIEDLYSALEINNESDLIDDDEFKEYYSQSRYVYPMGSNRDDDAYESLPLKVSLTNESYRSLTTKTSLKKFTPTSKRQKYGTCVGWAVAYSARTTLEAQRNNWSDKAIIDENAFSPAYLYRMVAPKKRKCDGANTSYAVTYLKEHGALPLKYWSKIGDEYYCPQNPIEETLIEKAKEYKIDEYARLFNLDYDYDKAKADKVKLSLDNENPVVVSLNCPPSFHNIKGDLWAPTEDPKEEYGGHAVTVVGYDDNKYGGAFLIQNSWGESFGDNGFVWVTYDDFNHFFYRALELVKLPKLTPEEPIFKGGLRFVNLSNNEDLEFSLAEKFRNWNTVLNNGEHTYKAKKPLTSGSQVRMFINNDQPAFVYILGTGSVNTSIAQLFPVEGLSAALNYETNEVALPTEDGAFVMDDTVGKDYMIMLFSREPLEIDTLNDEITKTSGKFSKRLKTVLGDKLIPFDDIEFEKNKIEFETLYKGDDNKIMALIIEFDHI